MDQQDKNHENHSVNTLEAVVVTGQPSVKH